MKSILEILFSRKTTFAFEQTLIKLPLTLPKPLHFYEEKVIKAIGQKVNDCEGF